MLRAPAATAGVAVTWRLLALPPLDAGLLEALFGATALGPDVELVVPGERTQAAVDALLPDVDLVLGDWSPALTVRDPGPRVAFVQQPSVGVDGIDLAACSAAGVPVANTAGANTVSVAEWVLAATLGLLRRTVEADAAVRRGEWPQTTLGGRELAGLRVGVVGMGPIGRRVATTFSALGCPVTYWSRTPKDDAPAPFAELDDLLAGSDVVVLVIALGPDTRGLLDARRLALMPPRSLLVNAARGDVVDEPALVEALRAGTPSGAALDVFAAEPLPADSPLRELPVLLSPHAAGSTGEASMRIVTAAGANLRRVLAGEPVLDVVNGVTGRVTRRG
ncbi:MAG: 3-phosphoglycerate dehydrogenase [Frankiales bacterium]|nr:3-phosphoglycerate dehydrogenase [Frankiales bacterium]